MILLIDLPSDVLFLIFEYLDDTNEIKKMPLVCKRFYNLDYTHLWGLFSKYFLRSEFYWGDNKPMQIPKTKNFHEWQSLMRLALDMAGGAPCISCGHDYANDLVTNHLALFYSAIGKPYTNIKQLHFINVDVLVYVTPEMYKLKQYKNLQKESITKEEIIQRFRESERYKSNPFGGYFYAWGDVIKK
jgi:hypothetical protein